MTPKLGAPEDFAAVREILVNAGYTQAAVLERMGIERMSEAARLQAGSGPDDLLDALIFALLLGCPTALPADLTRLLTALGLGEVTAAGFVAFVELYPVRGLYFISDRTRGAPLEAGEERVFSVISPQTEDFLATLPESPCPALLELCSGAAPAALIGASRYAVQAFGYDLSARSTLFAEFNARLNGIGNFAALRGDIYQPAGRRTFDRIVAHPPYVPTLRSTELLRDGGEEGETLTRRVIQGLPAHLHPGGRLYCLALVARRVRERLEDRVRSWLPERGEEFDVGVVSRGVVDPARFVFDNWHPSHGAEGDMARWQALFRKNRIEAFVYATIVIERAEASRPVRTIGIESGSPYSVEAVEALFAPEIAIYDRRPTVAPGVSMSVISHLNDGGWEDSVWRYEGIWPFRFSWSGPDWVRGFLSACDGSRTCGEHLAALQGVDGAEFESVVGRLSQGGILRL